MAAGTSRSSEPVKPSTIGQPPSNGNNIHCKHIEIGAEVDVEKDLEQAGESSAQQLQPPDDVPPNLASQEPPSSGVVGDAVAVVPETSHPKASARQENPFKVGQAAKLPQGKVNYLLQGPSESAPLVVCVHGLNGSMASFDLLLPQLWQHGFRTLVFDLYGFGMSASPMGAKLNQDTYVKQLEALLTAVAPSISKILLLGFSIGGIVATEYARRHPEGVSRLLLIAPAGLLAKSETPCHCFVFRCLRGPAGGCVVAAATCLAKLTCCCKGFWRRKITTSARALDAMTPDVLHPEKFQHVALKNVERLAWNISRALNSYLRVVRRMPLWEEYFRDAYKEVADGPVPVLFLWGDNDCTVPWDEVQAEVTRAFASSGTSCIMLPGAGHGMMLDMPEKVAQFASAWFSNSPDPAWKECLDMCRLDRAASATDLF
jgi:pimeloyl-ACP methyl ester carboxylesterase